MNKKNLLICCTGSVATIKLPQLITYIEEKVSENEQLNLILSIQVVMTKSAIHFCSKDEIQSHVKVNIDENEWEMWNKRGDPVLHIELSKWADVILIAPLDANTLAKIATGICDNLLTCTIRAWDITKPLIFCPAMNTKMWNHPITKVQISTLLSWGYKEVKCISKTLMCGDTGIGAMAEISTIGNFVIKELTINL
ncbi:phosphopantothenoylcysteine decarboxylase [Lycorma delicatula]|uniref:phosphopantothenoylcysteine decarboxylase n=1 Tax=Lycorma delicatula TaxID=130591 RepID=UPI003F50DD5A